MGCFFNGQKRNYCIVNAFQKKYQKGANQIRYGLIKVAKFYNNLFNRFLKINNIEMYSRYNEGKSAVAERTSKENLLLLKKHQS